MQEELSYPEIDIIFYRTLKFSRYNQKRRSDMFTHKIIDKSYLFSK